MVHEFTHKLYIFFVFVVKICRMGLSDFLYLSVRRPIYPGVKNEKKTRTNLHKIWYIPFWRKSADNKGQGMKTCIPYCDHLQSSSQVTSKY